eukprot:2581143-Pleurochrysis_carterae.AAC.1
MSKLATTCEFALQGSLVRYGVYQASDCFSVLPVLVMLSPFRGAGVVHLFTSCRVINKQHNGAAVEL